MERDPGCYKSCSSMMMNLERGRRDTKRKEAMRSKNLTNETHLLLLSALLEPPVKPLDVAGGLAAPHFSMSVLCAWKQGSSQGVWRLHKL